MTINDITKETIIKVSKNSWTIKDNNDKTRGVIRNITNIMEVTPSKMFSMNQKMKKIGIQTTGSGCIDRNKIFIKDDEIIYLNNIKSESIYKEWLTSEHEEVKQEAERYFNKQAAINELRNLIHVVDCIVY